MKYEKAYIVIGEEKFVDGIYFLEGNIFYPYEEFVDMAIIKIDELTEERDHYSDEMMRQIKLNESLSEENKTLKEECEKRPNSCRETRKKMWEIIDKRLSLFADEPIFSNWGDGRTLQNIRDSIIQDLQDEHLWVG